MDLIKIGKYIADKRKGLGMTQRQLAERLGMSDKSVSKWERGICLPDVSVYSALCEILGIRIHEFLAGEDIPQENILQKSEENILGVTRDSKQRQNRLKIMIGVLLILFVLIISAIAIAVYWENRPQNFIAPVDSDSVEMETARLFAGVDGAHIYKFTTTDAYTSLKLYVSEYQGGTLVNKGDMYLGFEGIDSPENGVVLICPDFKNFVIKIVISAGGARYSTEVPILEDVEGREYYSRSASDIREATDISYDEEQPLVALIYDNDILSALDIYDFSGGSGELMALNDYVYYFSIEFCKE